MSDVNLECNVNVSVKGKYRLVVRHEDGSETDTGEFDNLVLNSGLDAMGGTGINLVNYCVVGTNATVPAVTQTALLAQLGTSAVYASNGLSNSGSPLYIGTENFSYSFAVGQIVGTIAEIGVGPNSGGTGLFSRALIVDNLGNPTTITLLSTDQLIAYYSVAITPTLTDTTGTFTINAVSYNYTMRVANVGNFASLSYCMANSSSFCRMISYTGYSAGATLGAITGSPTAPSNANGDPGTNFSYSYSTYVPGSYTRSTTVVTAPAGMNLSGGIQGLVIMWGASFDIRYQLVLSAPIPKTNVQSWTMTYAISWSR